METQVKDVNSFEDHPSEEDRDIMEFRREKKRNSFGNSILISFHFPVS